MMVANVFLSCSTICFRNAIRSAASVTISSSASKVGHHSSLRNQNTRSSRVGIFTLIADHSSRNLATSRQVSQSSVATTLILVEVSSSYLFGGSAAPVVTNIPATAPIPIEKTASAILRSREHPLLRGNGWSLVRDGPAHLSSYATLLQLIPQGAKGSQFGQVISQKQFFERCRSPGTLA